MIDELKETGNLFLLILRVMYCMLGFAFGVFFAPIFIWFKIAEFLSRVMNLENLGYVFAPFVCAWILFLFINSTTIWRGIKRYVYTRSFKYPVSEENNDIRRKMWLEKHKGRTRTKNKSWRINISKELKSRTMVESKHMTYGKTQLDKPGRNFNVIYELTHHFKGNLPIKGDTITLTGFFTLAEPVSELRIRLFHFTENENGWHFLDESGDEGVLIESKPEANKKYSFTRTLTVNEDVSRKVFVEFYYPLDDNKSVFLK